MSSPLYPLTFNPIFKEKIWGGQKLNTHLNKSFSPLSNAGESWELSGVEGNISIVSNGQWAGVSILELIEKFKDQLVGKKVYDQFQNEFPLLIKYLDANDDLSIQVHPNDELAKVRHNSFGKTEMWYIMQADKGSFLYLGFDEKLSPENYETHIQNNTILQPLHQEQVSAGDLLYIPAGRVHAIGKGILLAEIQQTSDITYRIYDFDRADSGGVKRQLHTEESKAAIDFTVHQTYKTPYQKVMNQSVEGIISPYFKTDVLFFNTAVVRDYSTLDSFVALVCTEGEGEIIQQGNIYPIVAGQVYLIPASCPQIELSTSKNCKILETYIP